MQQQLRTYAIFGAVIAISSGFLGVYALPYFTSSDSNTNNLSTNGFMLGHVVLTVKDQDGNIKAYRQGDNIIVNRGEDCAVGRLFGIAGVSTVSPTGTTSCGGNPGFFQAIAIGNQTAGTGQALATDTALLNEHNQTGTGLVRANADNVVLTTASGSSASAKLTKQFTYSGSTARTVTESGIFNQTAIGGNSALFAHQTFSPVTLNNGESLTVEWTINIGGTTTLGGAETQ